MVEAHSTPAIPTTKPSSPAAGYATRRRGSSPTRSTQTGRGLATTTLPTASSRRASGRVESSRPILTTTKAKQPDSDGFVDLSNWIKKSRNFDFAFEDDNGRMVGASQFYDPDHSKFGESEDSSDSMIITRTQKEWSAAISTSVINGIDLEMQYDTEVWCVACSQLSNFKKQTN